ncbi:MAG: hypothetical protein K0R14_721 [Burkholderiales bacterium]|jgi:hypothetical protein|nr:hypothetical protein [Burkholderiales bacterium]
MGLSTEIPYCLIYYIQYKITKYAFINCNQVFMANKSIIGNEIKLFRERV